MPFNDTSAFLKSKNDYVTALKTEIKKLKPGVLGEFFFYDGIKVDGNDEAIVLLGKVKGSVAKELKSKASTKGIGQCFLEGSTINITLTNGKAPEAKLKGIFRETKNYGFKMVSADMSPAPVGSSDLEKVNQRFIKLKDDYARVKPNFDSASTKTVDTLISKIDTAITAPNPKTDAIVKAVKGLEQALTNLIKSNPDPNAGAAEKEQVVKSFKTLQAKTKKIKDALPQPDQDALNKMNGEFQVLFKAEDWPGCTAKIKEMDAELVSRAKLALAAQKSSASTKSDTIKQDGDSDAEILQLRQDLKDQDGKLNTVLKVMSDHMANLEKQRENLRLENAKQTPDPTIVNGIKTSIEDTKKRVAQARKIADAERKTYNGIAEKLGQKNEAKSGTATKELQTANKKIEALEDMLDHPSIEQAQSELSEAIKAMSEATEWREERLKQEAGSNQHGTGRHGAQTGLERQARRAATTEMETDARGRKKAKRGTGITPDQDGNVAGTSQKQVWNKVTIEYTEEGGRRVIKDRKKVAKAIAGVPARTGGSDTGSMWATPVLEKEAFDTANVIAKGMKDFPQYKKSRGYGDLKKLTVTLPPPKSAPGWGYAVKKNNDNPVDPAVAEGILKKFEEGKISLDKLFEEMNVTLMTDSDGRNMVRHATCVFTRDDTAGDFKLLTQYPNDGKGSGDVGWESNGGPSITQFRKDGDAKLWDADLSKVPLSISRGSDNA